MTLTRKYVGRLLVPWLLALGLACQGTSPTATPERPAASPPLESPTAARTATPPFAPPHTVAGPTGLAGQVLAASDVSDRPDVPLPEQLVLAVPIDQADEVLGPGSADLDEAGLRFLKASLPGPHPALTVALTDAAGRYALPLPPGDYLLCLADSDLTPPGLPARTRGCGRATVAVGSISEVDISSGFGEIVLIQP